jgi:hypothetical protein
VLKVFATSLVCRAESLKSSIRKTDDGLNQSLQGSAQNFGTVSAKKGDGGPKSLGPLGFALRDDKDTPPKPRSLPSGGSDGSYSSDEIQVLKYVLFNSLDSYNLLFLRQYLIFVEMNMQR